MAPSFLSLKSLRRRSRASFRTERSNDTSSEGSHSQGIDRTPTSGSLTPPSLGPHQSDPALNLQLKQQTQPQQQQTQLQQQQTDVPPVLVAPIPIQPRPLLANPNSDPSKRRSVSSMSGVGSPRGSPRLGSPTMGNNRSSIYSAPKPASPYAPRILNISDNTWVYQKVLLVHGTIGNPSEKRIDGTLTISRHDDAFPPVQWPVSDSHFKALIYMMPGANRVKFDFSSPKLTNSGTSNPLHTSYLTIHMVHNSNAPPVHLAIMMGKDSPGTFDAVPARIEREGNGLETAVRKFRMAAYLWQAYTTEQMRRNSFGRRCFRFDEEWTQGTSNYRDREMGTMRSEARIHIVKCDKTVEELRNLNRTGQNGELFGIGIEAMKNYFQPKDGQKLYVSCLILDSHWDPQAKDILAHAALGGGAGDISLGIFGSHCLQSYPTSFEEVAPAFTDCTPTDLNYVANDANESGSSWEACNIGMGAHLHETGHMLGLPHRPSGVMLRDYVHFNRSFVAREAYSTRTKSKGGLVLEADECTWHRLDCIHFRSHPCFRLPNDPPLSPDNSVQTWSVEGNNVIATAATGIAAVEIFAEGDLECNAWVEYGLENGAVQRQVVLSDQVLREKLPEDKRKSKMKVNIKSWGCGNREIEDFKEFCAKDSTVKFGNKVGFRSYKAGDSNMEGSQPHEVIFTSASQPGRLLTKVVVYNGAAIDGLKFVYDDDSNQLFGKVGGKEGGDTFELDIRKGEYITGFNIRAGQWVDGIQILTSLGRRSPYYGNPHGGAAHTFLPPRGYTICGIAGSCGPWLDGFSVIITH